MKRKVNQRGNMSKAVKSTKVIKVIIWVFLIPLSIIGADFDIYYDQDNKQAEFAAEEVETTLKKLGHNTDLTDLDDLNSFKSSHNVVIAKDRNSIRSLLSNNGGSVNSIGQQAYVLKTTNSGGKKAFWALGSDKHGIMYAGLALAEQISFNGTSGNIDKVESPHIKKRGIKFNVPLDRRSPTYDKRGTTTRENIKIVWDKSFWEAYLDDLARYRFNVLSLWNKHPFPSMAKVPGYEDIALDGVEWYDKSSNGEYEDRVEIDMSIEEKIAFWRYVMEYAHNRGIEVYFITWNVEVNGTWGNKYGISDRQEDQDTIDYLRASTKAFVKTYPHLSGLGVTAGEDMSNDANANEEWLAKTYKKGIEDAKEDNPGREIKFIHRYWETDYSNIDRHFGDYQDQFDMGFKYSQAHCYSIVNPIFATDEYLPNIPQNIRTWWNVRNDDNYIFRWGGHEYIRDYIKNLPPENRTAGYLLGSDGYVWGKNFITKGKEGNEFLEIKKHWYSFMLWGRMGYNPNTSKEVFTSHFKNRYSEINKNFLYDLWQGASNVHTLTNSFFYRSWDLGFQVEACSESNDGEGDDAPTWIDVESFMEGKPIENAKLMSIKDYVDDYLDNDLDSSKKTPFEVAQLLRGYANAVFNSMSDLPSFSNDELNRTLGDIKAMAHLGNYYSQKIRGATYLKLYDETGIREYRRRSISALEAASNHWKDYKNECYKRYKDHIMSRGHQHFNWDEKYQNTRDDIEFARDFDPNKNPIDPDNPDDPESDIDDNGGDNGGGDNGGDNGDLITKIDGLSVNDQRVSKNLATIDISSYSSVKIETTVKCIGADKMEDADYIRLYYSVDGGPRVQFFSKNNGFDPSQARAQGINGSSLTISIEAQTTAPDETYIVADIEVDGENSSNGEELIKEIAGFTVNSEVVSRDLSTVDISSYSSVSLKSTIECIGADKMEDADYIRLYYSVDGGPRVQFFSKNNGFAPSEASAQGISGNSLTISVEAETTAPDETYIIKPIQVSGSKKSTGSIAGISVNSEKVSKVLGTVNISSHSSVKLKSVIECIGADKMEDADFVKLYYSVDGGPRVQFFSKNNGFAPSEASAQGISGNSLTISVEAETTAPDETYIIGDISIEKQ